MGKSPYEGMVLGSVLPESSKRDALARFVHRYTGEHKPLWATDEPVQFKDDADWLAHTRFAVTKDGSLDRRVRYCESFPTWPNGKGLYRAVAETAK